METLITGGHGLLGSFIDFGLKPKKSELDLCNYDHIKQFIIKNDISSIIHMAAKVGGVKANSDYVFDFFIENIIMNNNIFKICKEYKISKSIFMMSTCAFPKRSKLPLREEYLHEGEPHESNYGYAYAKRMTEVASRALSQQYNLDSLCIIPCNLYGDNDNYNIENGHVIPSLIHKCYLAKITHTPMEIWGSGKAEREFVYAKDIAVLIKNIYQQNIHIKDNCLIVSPDDIYTIEEVVYLIAKIMKFSGKIQFDSSKPEGILRKNSSNTKFRKYFPDFKFTSIENGLSLTIEYFLKNYNMLRK